jgi:hypothetical protein
VNIERTQYISQYELTLIVSHFTVMPSDHNARAVLGWLDAKTSAFKPLNACALK